MPRWNIEAVPADYSDLNAGVHMIRLEVEADTEADALALAAPQLGQAAWGATVTITEKRPASATP